MRQALQDTTTEIQSPTSEAETHHEYLAAAVFTPCVKLNLNITHFKFQYLTKASQFHNSPLLYPFSTTLSHKSHATPISHSHLSDLGSFHPSAPSTLKAQPLHLSTTKSPITYTNHFPSPPPYCSLRVSDP